MDLLNSLTTDQLAILSCLGAVIVSMTIMSLSYYLGPASRTTQTTRRLPHVEQIKNQTVSEDRKAA